MPHLREITVQEVLLALKSPVLDTAVSRRCQHGEVKAVVVNVYPCRRAIRGAEGSAQVMTFSSELPKPWPGMGAGVGAELHQTPSEVWGRHCSRDGVETARRQSP